MVSVCLHNALQMPFSPWHTHCPQALQWPLPVSLLYALVSRGAAVLMETDEAVNGQTGGEQSGAGSAGRCRRSGGSRGGLPWDRRWPDTDRKDQRWTTHTETWREQRNRHTNSKRHSSKESRREGQTERALIWSCTLKVTNHRVTMVAQVMAHVKAEKWGRCVTIFFFTDSELKKRRGCRNVTGVLKRESSRIKKVGKIQYKIYKNAPEQAPLNESLVQEFPATLMDYIKPYTGLQQGPSVDHPVWKYQTTFRNAVHI